MQPIKEFDFSKLDSAISKQFIKIHNRIVDDLSALKSPSQDDDVKDFLALFLNKFGKLDIKNQTNVQRTIFCCSRRQVSVFYTESTPEKLDLKVRLSDVDSSKFGTKTKNFISSRIVDDGNARVALSEILPVIFNYKGRRDHLMKFYSTIGYQVCLFCLAQSTTTYKSSKMGKVYLTGNLDHILPKSKVPYLSISLNNLIPICAHCNQRKSDNPFDYDPFDSSQTHEFNFGDCIRLDDKNDVVLSSLDEIKIAGKNGWYSALTDKLDFTDLYKKFEGNAGLMVERFRKYHSRGYKKHIEETLNITDSRTRLEYFISEIPLIDENILKYPLTKFKMELFEELKRKYAQK